MKRDDLIREGFLIQDADGHEIEILGRTGIEYRKNGLVVFLDSELDNLPKGISVGEKSIRVLRYGNQDEPGVNLAKIRETIISDLRSAGWSIFLW